ncbi:M24 family metallopeptidase [Natrialbaceae archaeon GCM10025810]|uniref:M24 family metallopeptidase n=1 Tax=Halovalidus salilacus TaxID=3075124 RepID=UPI003618C3A7
MSAGREAVTTRGSLTDRLDDELDSRDAEAFVHAGFERDPSIRYCLDAVGAGSDPESDVDRRRSGALRAVAYDGDEWLVGGANGTPDTHPAADLADRLAERGVSGRVLTPAHVPHDAALHLENAGLSLASTDVVERARATKTEDERAAIEAAQRAASAGIEAAARVLADATVGEGGALERDGDPVTSDRLRIAVDETVAASGAFPAGNTEVRTIVASDGGCDRTAARGSEPLRPGDPIVVAVAPRTAGGYHGGLVRTLVVDPEGGPERRAHVALTQSFRSAGAMLTADEQSVAAVEGDLEAEVRSFGFGDESGVQARVSGVGLEARERPRRSRETIGDGSIVRLEVAVGAEAGAPRIRLADLLLRRPDGDGVEWLAAPSRSLDPRAVLDGR